MAFEFVNAQARIREFAGLSYILCPEPLEGRAREEERKPAPSARFGAAPGQRPWQDRQGMPQGQRQAEASRAAPRPEPARPIQRPQPARQAPQARSAPRPQPAPRPAPVVEARPELVATWPEGWQKLFARTKPGKVAWTYYGLGHDLCGQANKARSKKLSELIAYLAMPRGTHTFWPIGLPSVDEDGNTILALNREIFWQGLQLLNARMLIIMGSPAARAVGISGPISPTMPMRPINGMLTLLTWDIDDLDNTDHFARTQNYLRQTLTPLIC